jgi:hypothetical protein
MSMNGNPAAIRLQEAHDQSENRRLTGAARAEHDFHLALRKREGHAIQNDLVVERQRDPVERDGRRVRRGRRPGLRTNTGVIQLVHRRQ